jgi:chromosomal replication initiator protein
VQHAIWEELLKIVKEEAGSRVVETWLKAVTLNHWDALGKVVYLQAPNTFVKEWIKSNYTHLLQQHLARLLNVDAVKVVMIDAIDGESQHEEVPSKSLVHFVPAQQAYDVPPAEQKSRLVRTRPTHEVTLNKMYTFETFVVGSHNKLAYAAAQAVTQKLGRLYNPLFIYGPSGLGKTHLLHAIGNHIRTHHKSVQLLYQTADRFVNEFINAIRFDKVHQFKLKYHGIDVLLIDDVQFISNKDQTQEAFFHIFNALHESGKQIVFSSDCYPADISGLAERLRSRLEWGLVADIQLPSLETKIAILKQKSEAQNLILSDEVAEFIAARVTSNIRELEGAYIRVVAFAALTKQPITLELAKRVLFREQEIVSVAVNFDRIIGSLHKYYSYNLETLRSTTRNKQVVHARHVAMYCMKKMTDKSLQEIAHYLNRKDHSTVIHAIKQIQETAEIDAKFAAELDKIETSIKSS